jgi:pentapeptide repeat protein
MRGRLLFTGSLLIGALVAAVLYFPTASAVVALLALVACGAAAVVLLPPRAVSRAGVTDPRARLELENELRKTAMQALGGGALAVTLFSGIGSYLTQQRTARLTEEREYAAALAKNVDDLQQAPPGSPARVGAIYALGQLASAADARVNDPRLPYGRIVAQVLSTFVRQNHMSDGRWVPAAPDSSLLRTARLRDNPLNPFACAYKHPEPAPGLQAALEVLGKLQRLRVDDVTLQETDLRQAWIPETSFRGAYLRDAVLDNAVLRDADLRTANLEEAILYCADLQRVDLRDADLRNADLRGADLRGADLRDARLEGADLGTANLVGARLTIRQLARARNTGLAHLDAEIRRSLRGAAMASARR